MADGRPNVYLALLICAIIVVLVITSGYLQPLLKLPFGH
jgi:hypothetical protein